MNEFGALRAGLVARDADPDAELRRALGSAVAVHAAQQHLVDGDDGRHLRRLGRRERRRRPAVQPLPAGNIPAPNVVPQYVKYDPGSPDSTPTTTTSRRTSASPGGRTCRTAGSGRLLGDPEQATVRGGYSVAFNRERMDRFTGLYGGNSGGIADGATATPPRASRWSAGRVVAAADRETRAGSGRRPSRRRRTTRSSRRSAPATTSTSSIRTSRRRTPSRGWSASSARSARDTAVEVRYVGNRNQGLDDGELERPEHLRERLPRRVQARAGEPARAHHVGLRRHGQPLLVCLPRRRNRDVAAADLPRRSSAASPAQAGNAASTPSTNYTNSDWTGHLSLFEPDPMDAANDLWNNAGRPHERGGRRHPGELLRAESGRRRRQRHAEARPAAVITRCRWTCGAGSPTGSRYRPTTRSRGAGDRRSRICTAIAIYLQTDNVPHAFKLELGLRDPGRARPAVRHEHEQVAQRRARRLGVHRRRPRPGPLPRARRHSARGDERGRAEEGVQDPRRPKATRAR